MSEPTETLEPRNDKSARRSSWRTPTNDRPRWLPSLVVVSLLVASSPATEARAGRADEWRTAGWIIFGASYGPVTLFGLTMLAASGGDVKGDSGLFGVLCAPVVGPAIAGVSIMESHPLTVLCGLFLCANSIAQTVGLSLVIAAAVKGRSRCSRSPWRRPGIRIQPVVSLAPVGVGIVGRF